MRHGPECLVGNRFDERFKDGSTSDGQSKTDEHEKRARRPFLS